MDWQLSSILPIMHSNSVLAHSPLDSFKAVAKEVTLPLLQKVAARQYLLFFIPGFLAWISPFLQFILDLLFQRFRDFGAVVYAIELVNMAKVVLGGNRDVVAEVRINSHQFVC